MLSAQFLATSLIAALVPGAGVLYTVSTGLAQGKRAGIAAAFGCALGILPHLLAAALGLSLFINLSEQAFSILKFIGVGYLFYLAWRTWRDAGVVEIGSELGERGLFKVVWRAVVLSLTNPKLTIFFLAYLPAFIVKESIPAGQQLLGLSLVFMIVTFFVFSAYAFVAGTARNLLSNPQVARWLERSFAIIFATLAVHIAFVEY